MPLDPNIILQAKGIQLDNPIDMASKAMTLKQLSLQGQKYEKDLADEKSLKDAYSAGVVKNPDGTTSFDDKMTFSKLLETNPAKAMEFKKENAALKAAESESNFKKQMQEVDLISRVAPQIKDQASYTQALSFLGQNGIDTSKMPQGYDPNLINRYSAMASTAKEKLEQQWREREVKAKEVEASKKNGTGENLPIDKKDFVKTLATGNAKVTTIKGQLDAFLNKWPTLTESQKLDQGRLLLKTLNSPQGSDAVGAEEVKRLGSKLQFALGNLSNDNPVQFGRDLEGFADQVRINSEILGEGLASNQVQIDQAMGRSAPQQQTQKSTPQTVVQNGHTYTLNPKTGKYE